MLGKPENGPERSPALNLARKAYLEAYAAIAARLRAPVQSVPSAKSVVPSSSSWTPVAFEDLFYCRSCRRPVRIRVPAGVSAFMPLRFVDETLNNLCPACLAKEKRN